MSFYNTDNWPEKSNYYRMPWSNNDNPISWLEITDICNIYCKGCYRKNLSGHRPLDELKKEVDFFIRMRNTDSISIAGGEPLIYPDIVKLVEYIARKGVKPIIISNTYALTETLARDLFNAGWAGITCHIDMIQDRPDTKEAKSELDIMKLRQEKADLLWSVTRGRINVTFNATVYHQNFKYIPDIVNWARKNPRRVHGLVFICYRGIPLAEGVNFDAGEKVDLKAELGYTESDTGEIDITSVDVYNLLKDKLGDTYEPCAYLGGTGHIKDYKWFVQAGIVDKNGRDFGSIGPRTMEYLQTQNHWRKGTYFVYFKKNVVPRLGLAATALIGDKNFRKPRRKIMASMLNPVNLFRPVYSQTIGIVQAPDMMENGMPSMCESCPDMCVWEGNLVNSCRLDEYRKYGRMLNAIVRTDDAESDKREKVGAE